VGWPAGGWLQPSFFIVCLNQGHFFHQFLLFFSIFFLQNIMGREVESGGKGVQGHESPKKSLRSSLPGSYQNLIMIMMKSIMTDDDY
jgi:hypothetical protein